MINEQVNIDNYIFIRDQYGNLHRNLGVKDNDEILSFYSTSIYLSGQFWQDDILSLSEQQLAPLKQKEGSKAQQVLDVINKQINGFGQTGSLLEIGCGAGSFLHSLSDTKLTLEGIDISEYSIPVSKKLYGNHRFNIIQQDVVEYFNSQTQINKYDYIVVLDLLEHIDMDTNLLESFKSHLKKQGKLILLVPLYDTSDLHALTTATDVYPEHHLHLYCEQGLDEFLNYQGFKIESKAKFKSGKKLLYILSQ